MPRALDKTVDMPVHDIIISGARPAHNDGADHEQQKMNRMRRLMRRQARQSIRPPTWQKEQPPANGPVEPCQLDIGMPSRRREPEKPEPRGIGQRHAGMNATRAGIVRHVRTL
jgi:hypothetical protein